MYVRIYVVQHKLQYNEWFTQIEKRKKVFWRISAAHKLKIVIHQKDKTGTLIAKEVNEPSEKHLRSLLSPRLITVNVNLMFSKVRLAYVLFIEWGTRFMAC